MKTSLNYSTISNSLDDTYKAVQSYESVFHHKFLYWKDELSLVLGLNVHPEVRGCYRLIDYNIDQLVVGWGGKECLSHFVFLQT